MFCTKRQARRPSSAMQGNYMTVSVFFCQRGTSLRRKNSLRRSSSFKKLSFTRKQSKKDNGDGEEHVHDNNITSFLEIQPPKNGTFSAQISLKTFGDASKIMIEVNGSRLQILKVSSGLGSCGSLPELGTIEDQDNIRKRVFLKRFGEKESFIRKHSTVVRCPQEHQAKMNGTQKTTSCGYIILPSYIDADTLEFFIDGQKDFNIRGRVKGALPCTKPESPKPTKTQLLMSSCRSMFSCMSARPQHEYCSRVCSSTAQFLSQKLSWNLASSITIPLSSQKCKLGKNGDSMLDLTFPVRYQGTVTVKGVFKPNEPMSGKNKKVTQKGKFVSCLWMIEK